jgi:polyhydroxyalkanoate synthesis regulator phasin
MVKAYQDGTKEGHEKAKKLAKQIVDDGGMTDKSKQKDVDHILGK